MQWEATVHDVFNGLYGKNMQMNYWKVGIETADFEICSHESSEYARMDTWYLESARILMTFIFMMP